MVLPPSSRAERAEPRQLKVEPMAEMAAYRSEPVWMWLEALLLA